MKRSPDFFVVGAAKAGTTSLWKYLNQHPDIFLTSELKFKELGFYSPEYGLSDKSKYIEHFEDANDNQLIGEVCTSYLTSPSAAQNIKDDNPDAKIIISLRNPIDRALSLYLWMTNNGYEYCNSFEQAIRKEKSRMNNSIFKKHNPQYFYNYLYLESGKYFSQVSRFFNLFGRENCLIIIYENWISNPETSLTNVDQFLGVDNFIHKSIEPQNISREVKNATFQFVLRQVVSRALSVLGLGNFNDNRFIARIRELNMNTETKTLTSEQQTKLSEYFRKDNKMLSNLIEKDIEQIWQL